MEEIILTWDNVVNRYDDDQQLFEEYICDQLGIPLPVVNDCEDWENVYIELEKQFSGKKFVVRPNYDYIQWRGKINSDFRVREVTE